MVGKFYSTNISVAKLMLLFPTTLLCLLLPKRDTEWHNCWDFPKLQRAPPAPSLHPLLSCVRRGFSPGPLPSPTPGTRCLLGPWGPHWGWYCLGPGLQPGVQIQPAEVVPQWATSGLGVTGGGRSWLQLSAGPEDAKLGQHRPDWCCPWGYLHPPSVGDSGYLLQCCLKAHSAPWVQEHSEVFNCPSAAAAWYVTCQAALCPQPAPRSQASGLFRWPLFCGWQWWERWGRDSAAASGGESPGSPFPCFSRYLRAEENHWSSSPSVCGGQE